MGEPPSWYSGDFIFVKQNLTKYKNVNKNLREAILSDKVQDTFVVMNDDFYIFSNNLSYFHEGRLEEKHDSYIKSGTYSAYSRIIFQTLIKLKALGFEDPLSYELHIPFVVEKHKLSKIIKYDNLLWRSLYGNMFSVGGDKIKDVKVYHEKDWRFHAIDYSRLDLLYLSSNDRSFNKLKNNFLKNKFFEKCILEEY